ncbi:MAG TPA: hypothetical protein DCM28_19615 [Phycisphaerales bacterium]|nr:hypothetical protein [Phycisphaerales bacterium]HCD32865.1 hypothetical protein [Phycisphaerales bacterium]
MSDQINKKTEIRNAYHSLKYQGDLVEDINQRVPKPRRRTIVKRMSIAALIAFTLWVGLAIVSQKHTSPLNISKHMHLSLKDSLSLPTSVPNLIMPAMPRGMSFTPSIPGRLPSVGQLPSVSNDASRSKYPVPPIKELSI